jgi:hypothetical protein
LDEHKTVLLSILATLLAAVGILAVTVLFSGGISIVLIQAYVLPLIVSSFALAVFALMLFARKKGKMPGFPPDEVKQGTDSRGPSQVQQRDKDGVS